MKSQRVKITSGAWKGETGFIIAEQMENKAWPICLESGINLVWFESEFEQID